MWNSCFENSGWARRKNGFVAESYLLATICHLLSLVCGSAAPGYMGYPELTISGPVIVAISADWTPTLFLIPLKGEVLFVRVIQRCVWGNTWITAQSIEKGMRQKASGVSPYIEMTEWCPSSFLYFGFCWWFPTVPLRVIFTIFLLTMNVRKIFLKVTQFGNKKVIILVFFVFFLWHLFVNCTYLHHSWRLPCVLSCGSCGY